MPAVLRLRVDASICATEPNTPAPHGDLDRWPEVALYCSRRQVIAMARRLPPGRASVTGLYSRTELLDAVRRWRRLYGCAPVRSDWDPVRAPALRP